MSQETSGQYRPQTIEKKWQTFWSKHKVFADKDFDTKPKYYVLDMFPYPSGDGLHVGHVEGYTATDIVARFKRMSGFNVLHPMGWDAFGLPAEQYAIKTSTHPVVTTQKNISNFKRQMNELGLSYNWDRELDTTDPKYYRWTQWIFRKLYERGLAYESWAPVNWCPALGTVLANEEVIDGKSEVGGFPVIKKPLRQWVLKITEYAERLLNDLEEVDWPESTKEMQRNWIGKSIGAEISFSVKGHGGQGFTVFSTRPDTLFGASFCVLAPEHPLLKEITSASQRSEVEAYVENAVQESETERTNTSKEKTGVFTGAYAINPVNQKELPIFVADYVLMTYGTGAVMGVPGHDDRDHEFARKFSLPILAVLSGGAVPVEEAAHTGDGKLINSDFLNGLNKDKAIEAMCHWLEEHKQGTKSVRYKLRDWIFSRQRYWGEPFPIAHDKDGRPVLIREEDLPVTLPELQDYKPSGTGEPPLSKAADWTQVTIDGKPCTRETNIMPQWAGSCWYYLRFIDPHNDEAPWDPAKEKYWLPVDLYVGGVEHANLHLLYARFWHKVLYDVGVVSTKEPFKKILHPGIVLGSNGEKMSKSRGNVVNPDDVVKEWGADCLRLFEMFLGPFDQMKPWQTSGITGIHRFLSRVWRLMIDEQKGTLRVSASYVDSPEAQRALHRTIKKVSEDTEHFRFNTAISAMMEYVNTVTKEPGISHQAAKTLLQLLAPYAPHMAEELWERLGEEGFLTKSHWPAYDEALTEEAVITLSVMVGGKLRGTIQVPKDAPQEQILALARQDASIAKHLEGKAVKKEIYVPGKVVNFVV